MKKLFAGQDMTVRQFQAMRSNYRAWGNSRITPQYAYHTISDRLGRLAECLLNGDTSSMPPLLGGLAILTVDLADLEGIMMFDRTFAEGGPVGIMLHYPLP